MKRIRSVTILLWLVITALYAWFYVSDRAVLPGNEGYESLRKFQFVAFLATRYPFFVVSLGLILWIEHRFFRSAR